MKRIISLLMALTLMLGIATINVSGTENYGALFDDTLSCLGWVQQYGNEETPWSANAIAYVTAMNFKNYQKYYNKDKSDAWNECYSLPKKKFEKLANKLFNVEVDLTTADFNSIQKVRYDKKTKTYDLVFIPAGSGNYYALYGYSKAKQVYTVYMQEMSREEPQNSFLKVTANCDGKYVKIIACEKVDKAPKLKSLITSPKKISINYCSLETSTTASLSWNYTSGTKKYKLQYKATDAKKWKSITTKKSSAAIKGLKGGKKYAFKVTAITDIGNTTSAKVYLTTLKTVSAKVKSKTKSSVKLSWKKNKNADGYIVYRKASKNAEWKEVKILKKNTTTSYTVKKLKSKTKYYFKVVSYIDQYGWPLPFSGKTVATKTK